MPFSRSSGALSRTYGHQALSGMPLTDRLPWEVIGTRLRSPFQSSRPPCGPVARRVMVAPLPGRVVRLCSSNPSGLRRKSMGSLGRRSWKCRLPSASSTRSICSGKGAPGGSALDWLGGSLNRRVRFSVPFSANSSSVCGPSSSTSDRCRWRSQRLSSSALA
ncbi:hypothetical protein D3C81_1681420 [compost metagenome]